MYVITRTVNKLSKRKTPRGKVRVVARRKAILASAHREVGGKALGYVLGYRRRSGKPSLLIKNGGMSSVTETLLKRVVSRGLRR